jgi:polyisoprenoid-binding protein YceI
MILEVNFSIKKPLQLNVKAFLLALICILPLSAFSQEWEIVKEGVNISFDGNGAEGTINDLTGNIVFDPSDLSNAKFEVFLDLNSLTTDNDLKTKHAKGDSWFDVMNYPTARFTSKSFEKTGADSYLVNGILNLKGVERKISIPFKFNSEKFTGTFQLNRQDFAIKGPFFSFTVGDDFKVYAEVPVRKSKD